MPDSEQPPFWGPAYHERDLDALLSGLSALSGLSGEAARTPAALRPVARTLAALRAAPTRRELSDEAAARAAFRALASPQAAWAARAEHATVTGHTLVLPPPDLRRPRRAGHRRRRATWEAHRAAIAMTGVAAAALIVIAVAVAGAIPGSIGQMMSFRGHPTSAASPAVKGGRTPVSLEGTGASSPTPMPTPTPEVTGTASATAGPRATSDQGTLCREIFERSVQQNRTTWLALFGQLSSQAGGQSKVLGYCLRYLGNFDWAKMHWPSPVPSSGAFPSGFPTAFPSAFPGGPAARGKGDPGRGKRGFAGLPG